MYLNSAHGESLIFCTMLYKIIFKIFIILPFGENYNTCLKEQGKGSVPSFQQMADYEEFKAKNIIKTPLNYKLSRYNLCPTNQQ